MQKKLPILLAAAFGGISPNLMRLALQLTQKNAELPEATYLLGLVIFAIMGAVIALIWEETDFKKAFYLGIGLPAFIQMGAGEIQMSQQLQQSILPPDQPAQSQLFNAPDNEELFHQALLLPQESSNRKLQITVNKIDVKCFVIFESESKRSEEAYWSRALSKYQAFDVPDFATRFYVRISKTVSEPVQLPKLAGSAPKYLVSISKARWSGFFEALGFSMSSNYKIELIAQQP